MELTQDFKSFIRETVIKYYDETGKALLLAALGEIAARHGIRLADELKGIKLSQYIRDELGDDLDVIRSGSSVQVLSVQPKGKIGALNGDTVEIARAKFPLRTTSRALQAAFLRPVPSDTLRYVVTHPKIFYADVRVGEPAPEGGIELHSSFLPDPNKLDDGNHLLDCIQKWADNFQVNIDYDKSRKATQDSNWLFQLIDSLSEEEQRRVSLPLDIVAKLLRK